MARSRAARAADPNTPLADLAALAHEHPAVRAAVAANPSTYPDLLAWLAELGDPDVDAAIASRETAGSDEITTDAIRAADPTTSQLDLSALAHAKPELRAVIAANPNAYDDLRTWIAENPAPSPKKAAKKAEIPDAAAAAEDAPAVAETTVLKPAASTSATVAVEPPPPPSPAASAAPVATPPPAAPAPAGFRGAARSGAATGVSAGALRFAAVAYVASTLSPLFFFVSLAFPANSFALTAMGFAFLIPLAILLLSLIVAAAGSDRPLPTKVVAIVLAVVAAALIVLPGLISLPVVPFFAPFAFFLSWALTAGFRGWGYFGLVMVLAIIGLQWLSSNLVPWGTLFFLPAIIFAAIGAAAIAGTAALEKAFAGRQGITA